MIYRIFTKMSLLTAFDTDIKAQWMFPLRQLVYTSITLYCVFDYNNVKFRYTTCVKMFTTIINNDFLIGLNLKI